MKINLLASLDKAVFKKAVKAANAVATITAANDHESVAVPGVLNEQGAPEYGGWYGSVDQFILSDD